MLTGSGAIARVIDGRYLEPPEPFVQTLEALDTLGAGERLLLRVGREPFPLYRALELNGFAWQSRRDSEGGVEVLIWRKTAASGTDGDEH